MGCHLERDASRRSRRELRYFLRYVVVLAGPTDPGRVCGLDCHSLQELTVPGNEATILGPYLVPGNCSGKRRFILAASFASLRRTIGTGGHADLARRGVARAMS